MRRAEDEHGALMFVTWKSSTAAPATAGRFFIYSTYNKWWCIKNLSVSLLLCLPFGLSVFILSDSWYMHAQCATIQFSYVTNVHLIRGYFLALLMWFRYTFPPLDLHSIVCLSFAAPHELAIIIISQNYSFSANLANELKNNILHQLRIEAFLNNNEVSCTSALKTKCKEIIK